MDGKKDTVQLSVTHKRVQLHQEVHLELPELGGLFDSAQQRVYNLLGIEYHYGLKLFPETNSQIKTRLTDGRFYDIDQKKISSLVHKITTHH
jgi:hypothetical protein